MRTARVTRCRMLRNKLPCAPRFRRWQKNPTAERGTDSPVGMRPVAAAGGRRRSASRRRAKGLLSLPRCIQYRAREDAACDLAGLQDATNRTQRSTD